MISAEMERICKSAPEINGLSNARPWFQALLLTNNRQEPNHIFAETAGATLSLADGHLYFEQYVPLSAIGRGEGAGIVKLFVVHARDWRQRIAGRNSADADTVETDISDMPSSFRA
jgi:hypothetical protein